MSEYRQAWNPSDGIYEQISSELAATVDAIQGIAHSALVRALKEGCSLTFTGYQLGGWLAQVALFLALQGSDWDFLNFKFGVTLADLQVQCVVFDSPGVRTELEECLRRPVSFQSLRLARDLLAKLDDCTTNLISQPFSAQLLPGAHFGSLYSLFVQDLPKDTVKPTEKTEIKTE